MNRPFEPAVILAVLVLTFGAGTVCSQVRPEETAFVKARLGFSVFMGDQSRTDSAYPGFGLPLGLGLEAGYQFMGPWSAALGYQFGSYRIPAPNQFEDDPSYGRHSVQALARYQFSAQTSTLAPFVTGGLHITGGYKAPQFTNLDAGEGGTGFGPVLGAGLDYALNPRMSVTAELLSSFSFPDNAVDGREANGFAGFDLLSQLGVGFKYSLKSAFTPVVVSAIECPTLLEVGQNGTFTARTNDQVATPPIEYRWEFGDGQVAIGPTTEHLFLNPGTFTARFTAQSRRNSATETCTIQVNPRPEPAVITGMNASSSSFDVCNPVTVLFTGSARGKSPISYTWDFGDGTTAVGSAANHTYTREGTYTVTFTAMNDQGVDTRTTVIRAARCETACRDVSDLNAVYFDRNSSTLTAEGRAALRENIDIVAECPTLCVRIEGWAGPDERDAEALSDDRASAVEEYYIENGLNAGRFRAMGMGQVQGLTSKKEGAQRARRVDSLPGQCRSSENQP